MSSGNIVSISAFEAIDSRGLPTVSATVTLKGGVSGSSLVPSGASTGEHEALELRDSSSKRHLGKGTLGAIKNINDIIAPALLGRDITELSSIDNCMIELDGTENKSKLGANAILAVSLASAHAGANLKGQPLFQYLGGVGARRLPIPLVNVINGGAHAANSLDFQEFMLVPRSGESFADNLAMACEVFQTLKADLISRNLSVGLGDEGGFAPNFSSQHEALDALMQAIDKAGYRAGEDISLALDVAASEFYNAPTGTYHLKKSSDAEALSASDLVGLYKEWCSKYPIVSIEDGLDENDWDGWQTLTSQLGDKLQLVGDDLFVTNKARVAQGISKKAGNAVLIKLNQIGTVTETLETIELAEKHGYRNVISHRSGETEDTTIADLAVATGAGQIKTGSVCRGERTAKYNRLLWIESFLGNQAQMKDSFA